MQQPTALFFKPAVQGRGVWPLQQLLVSGFVQGGHGDGPAGEGGGGIGGGGCGRGGREVRHELDCLVTCVGANGSVGADDLLKQLPGADGVQVCTMTDARSTADSIIDVIANSAQRTTSPHSPPARNVRPLPLFELLPPTLLPLHDGTWGGEAMLRTDAGVLGFEAEPLATGVRIPPPLMPLSLPAALRASDVLWPADGLENDFAAAPDC